MPLIRDFIPADQALNAAELSRYKRATGRSLRSNEAVAPDFIPGPRTRKAAKGLGRDRAADRSWANALRSQARGASQRVEAAKKAMRAHNVPETIALIESVSPNEQSYYLIAEAMTQARPDVLSRFPKPDKRALERYLSENEQE